MNDNQTHKIDSKPSKSSLKRKMHFLQQLGEKLLTVSDTSLDQLPISENLLSALQQARKIKPGNGRRRQLQYIGKLMRNEDSDAIHNAYYLLQQPKAHILTHNHLAEHWRQRFIDEGTPALTEFAEQFTVQNLQLLHQLIRRSLHAHSRGEQPKAYHQLITLIKASILHNSLSDSKSSH